MFNLDQLYKKNVNNPIKLRINKIIEKEYWNLFFFAKVYTKTIRAYNTKARVRVTRGYIIKLIRLKQGSNCNCTAVRPTQA